jgi:predicted RNase H-like nuclease (RuvC/YqgF family)
MVKSFHTDYGSELKPEIIYYLTALPSRAQKGLSEALAVLSSLQESKHLQDVILANKEQSRLRVNALERAQNAEHSNNQSSKRLKAAKDENDKLRRNKAEQEEQTNNLSCKVKSLEEQSRIYLRAFKTVQDSIKGLDHSPTTSTNPSNAILLSDDEQDGKIQVTTRAGGKRKWQ